MKMIRRLLEFFKGLFGRKKGIQFVDNPKPLADPMDVILMDENGVCLECDMKHEGDGNYTATIKPSIEDGYKNHPDVKKVVKEALKIVNDFASIPRELADKYQDLFNFLNQEHNLLPTVEQMDEIILEVGKFKAQFNEEKPLNITELRQINWDNISTSALKFVSHRVDIQVIHKDKDITSQCKIEYNEGVYTITKKKPLKIEWEFESWAEQAVHEANILGLDEQGNRYDAIGIIGFDREIEEVKDITPHVHDWKIESNSVLGISRRCRICPEFNG